MLRHSALRIGVLGCSARLSPATALAVIAGVFAIIQPIAAHAQTTTRTIVVTRTSGGFAGPSWAAQDFGRYRSVTTIRQSVQTDVGPRAVRYGVVPVDQLPVVAGIRRPPVAPPTVYRIEGPRTTMHKADEERMRQVNPGARVITPDDLMLSPQTRARYGSSNAARLRDMRRRHAVVQDRVMMPQVIIVRPSGTY
ncbi:MAG: hypothetical protein ACRCWO_05020 [Bosea sp. (in: a-proteobacteria)]